MLSVFLMSGLMVSGLPAQDTTPAGNAVKIDAYSRDYEDSKSAAEAQYDSNIWSAYSAKVGQMEGSWVVSGDSGNVVALELRRETDGGLDGAWRSMQGATGINASGFVSNIALTNNDLEINYIPGRARSPNILHLKKQSDGSWRGTMMDVTGRKVPVVMARNTGR